MLIKKKIFLLAMVIGVGYALFVFGCYALSDRFSPKHVISHIPYSSRWEVASPSIESITPVLAQPFYYLGMGSQCYVFESADGRYVLKLVRSNRYQPHFFQKLFSSPSFLKEMYAQKASDKKKKQEAFYASCLIAYRQLPLHTRILYLHLNPTQKHLGTVLLHDKLRRPYQIDLDQTAFILQEKGELLYPYLTHLFKEKKYDKIHEALHSLAATLVYRCRLGIADHDAVLHKNTGFCHGSTIFLDIGAFANDPSLQKSECQYYEVMRISQRFRLWLEKKDPELALLFEKDLKPVLKDIPKPPEELDLGI